MVGSVDQLGEEQVAQLREAFATYDKDGDGRITLAELRDRLEELGEAPTDADLKAVIVKADADGNDTIDFAEFLAFMRPRIMRTGPRDEFREAFDGLDRDGDGLVSVDELLHVMGKIGEEMTRQEAEVSLRRGDTDGDGRLSYDEFVAFMLSPR